MTKKIKKCPMRGFAEQCKRQTRAITARAPKTMLMLASLVLLSALAAVEPWGKNGTVFRAIFSIWVATTAPFFSEKTLSRDRANGGHLNAIEHGHRRGIMIASTALVDTLFCIISAAAALATYTASTYLHTDALELRETANIASFMIAISAHICCLNTCISSYSTRRTAGVIFGATAISLIATTAAIVGTALISNPAYHATLLATGILFLPLSYLSYKWRMRIV